MVPTRTRQQITKRQTSRSQNPILKNIMGDRIKRKAESPPKGIALKRSAFGNLTNAIDKTKADKIKKAQPIKKLTVQTKGLPVLKTVKVKDLENVPPVEIGKKPVTRASLKGICNPAQTVQKPKEVLKSENRVKTRLSNEFDKTDESLYTSALENLCDSTKSLNTKTTCVSTSFKTPTSEKSKKSPEDNLKVQLNIGNHVVPAGINDFDKENWNDIFQVSHYAMDIFNYMKQRETHFEIKPYMDRQVCLSPWMRSLLIDWMVEVQESFELNHETLYLGVKLVDLYLSKVIVGKETLQLVGAAAMFVSSKYDERIPPLIDDFLYICDGAYSKRELIRMEMNLLKICDFNLGMPLSYRFLRRYARCAKVAMPVLTLARYILEYSLMDYVIVSLSDSKLAAAALYLALKMKNVSNWTATLEFYTGYKLTEFFEIVVTLNNGLHKKPKEQLSTVRNKYSHKIFFEVAKTDLITNDRLLNE